MVRRNSQGISERVLPHNRKLARGALPLPEAGRSGFPTLEVARGHVSYWKSLRRTVHTRKLEKAVKKDDVTRAWGLQKEEVGNKK